MSKTYYPISFGFFLLSFLGFLLALMSPYWYYYDNIFGNDEIYGSNNRGEPRHKNGGLWLECVEDIYYQIICDTIQFENVIRPVRISFILMLFALLLNCTTFGLYIRSMSKGLRLRLPGYTCALGAFLELVAVIDFGASELIRNASWSYYLACVSCAVQVITSVVTIIFSHINKQDDKHDKVPMFVDDPHSASFA